VSQSPFGQAAAAAGPVSSFGKPTSFGQPAGIAQFGKPAVAFGMQQTTPSPPSGFGAAAAQAVGQSPFASFGQQAPQASAFGQPQPANQGGQFGVSSTPFGQPQQQPGGGGGFGGGAFGGAPSQMTSPTGFSNKMKSNPSAWQPRR
jgi:hypothetical protein